MMRFAAIVFLLMGILGVVFGSDQLIIIGVICAMIFTAGGMLSDKIDELKEV